METGYAMAVSRSGRASMDRASGQKHKAMQSKPAYPIATAAALIVCTSLACSSVSDDPLGVVKQPAICGDTTDWQEVESYDGTLGPTIAFVAEHSPAVGRLRISRTEPDGIHNTVCTGTMIAPRYFLTNHHCTYDADKSPVYRVDMNYQLDPSGHQRPVQTYGATRIEWASGFDYAILETDGPAGTDWGMATPAAFSEPDGQAITMIQHPSGSTKKVDGGTWINLPDGLVGYNDIDMVGGSSGSGLLRDVNGELIGINKGGPDTCDETNPNHGLSMLAIWGASPIVHLLALDTAKVVAILN